VDSKKKEKVEGPVDGQEKTEGTPKGDRDRAEKKGIGDQGGREGGGTKKPPGRRGDAARRRERKNEALGQTEEKKDPPDQRQSGRGRHGKSEKKKKRGKKTKDWGSGILFRRKRRGGKFGRSVKKGEMGERDPTNIKRKK